ncbi:hypothetical protein TEA_021736 [Camellia sinensis var. sinensis]|uniref:40S ribosomal protein S8 n=1 Tax=Camellia sinensis var. sinensis TaxID=542762 RepID=A0A4S4E0N0_CAMSN|nr:hypothetical protein TEA_021736 [Camellia sinensis var. sinensis]
MMFSGSVDQSNGSFLDDNQMKKREDLSAIASMAEAEKRLALRVVEAKMPAAEKSEYPKACASGNWTLESGADDVVRAGLVGCEGVTQVEERKFQGMYRKFEQTRLRSGRRLREDVETGNFSWGSEAVTRKTRLLDVVYNASNNELVRTQTLVKSAIIQVDAAPFKQWYLQHYGVDIGRKRKTTAAAKKEGEEGDVAAEETKKSNHIVRKLEKRQQERKLDPHVEEQFGSGRLLAAISSRPGQCGRADGYAIPSSPFSLWSLLISKY